MRSERGAGSLLTVGIMAVLVTAMAVFAPLAAALIRHQALAGAADSAALAAADVRMGALPGDPCAVAAHVARSNDARVAVCRLDGLVATVRVATRFGIFELDATATAGPPPTGSSPPERGAD